MFSNSLTKKKFLLLVVALMGSLLFSGCTYEEKISGGAYNFPPVISLDGEKAVYLEHIATYRKAKGITAFPDGGIPKTVENKILLYITNSDGSNKQLVTEIKTPGVPKSGRGGTIMEGRLNWVGNDTIKYFINRQDVGKFVSFEGKIKIPESLLGPF